MADAPKEVWVSDWDTISRCSPIGEEHRWVRYIRADLAQPQAQADAEQLARRIHEAYERLAPSFGYETRKETRAFDPTTPNGKLMIAVCAELQSAPTPAPISSSIGDHGAQATADPGADPNAEWNAACEACAKAIDDESVLSGFWAADLCRDLKRNGEKETT
jgi:hypothetical protein